MIEQVMISVNVIVNGRKLEPINVSYGKQTIKWLANIIQSRLSELRSPAATGMRGIVTAMRDEAGDLANPTSKICDFVSDFVDTTISENEKTDNTIKYKVTFTAEVCPRFTYLNTHF